MPKIAVFPQKILILSVCRNEIVCRKEKFLKINKRVVPNKGV